MKEQFAILPELPIVGVLKLASVDHKSLTKIEVINKDKTSRGLNSFFNDCYQELKAYLVGEKRNLSIPFNLPHLKPFELRVLQEIQQIPYNQLVTYKDIAHQLNNRAYQAVGSACGKNPLLLIIPCHRVIGSRNLGGFAHGLEMKRALIELEQNN